MGPAREEFRNWCGCHAGWSFPPYFRELVVSFQVRGHCSFPMMLGLWVSSSFQRADEQRKDKSVESLPGAQFGCGVLLLASIFGSSFVSVGDSSYFSPPPPLSPKLSFKLQGLRDASSLPLSCGEGGQGSWGQVLTVTLLDKVGQAFFSKAFEQGLISSGANCFLPGWPLIVPVVRSVHLRWVPGWGGPGGETARGCTSQLINIVYNQGEGGAFEFDMQTYAKSYVDYSGFRMETPGGLVLFFNRNSVLMSHT